MSDIVSENKIDLDGLNVKRIVRDNGRVENHLLVPSDYKELLLDLSFNNLEQSLNNAQRNSFLELFKREMKIDSEKFNYETEFYSLRTETSMKFNSNDIPKHKIPPSAQFRKVDAKKFAAHSGIDEETKSRFYGDPYLTMFVRSGAFASMAEQMIPLREFVEDGVSRPDQLLSALLTFQTRDEEIAADLNAARTEFKSAMTELTTHITADDFSNAAVYYYAEDIDDKTDSRVSMSKARRFQDKPAKKWLDAQSKIAEEEVTNVVASAVELRKNWPEIYKLGQSEQRTIVVEEID